MKLATLPLAATALAVWGSLPVAAGTALGAALLLASLGRRAWTAAPGARGLAVALALIVALHAWQDSWGAGLAAALRVLTLVVLGYLLTATTRFEDLLGIAEALCAPFRLFGLRPDRLALGLGLMLRFVESFFAQWQRLDEAHRVRAGRSGGLKLLAPLALHVMRTAERVGDALTTRLGD
ncbi:MAG: energy-coupling factor transporter transmembrane protein EcfT [Acetobacteraceae bacterium]|nr:energy-coupling factor transporter transmembrane protein EcfT [Acetobacteraceae bacterium]